MRELRRIIDATSRFPGKFAALATIVRTRGSTYRRPGTRMLVTAAGERIGAVSSGCLEDEIAARAQQVIATGEACLLAFDTRRTFGCDGLIEVLIERISDAHPVISFWKAQLAARQPGVVATIFAATETGPALGSHPCATNVVSGLPPQFLADSRAALDAGRSAVRNFADADVFFHVLQPAIRLVLVGAGDDAVPLANLAQDIGWELSIIAHPSERHVAAEIASSSDFRVRNPHAVAAELRPDEFTAVVLMTHHFGRDLAFLDALLPLPLPYLGLLGPRKRREQLLAELASVRGGGLDPASLSKLRSPVGLDLGAESPEEIALSIAAEIRAVLGSRTGKPLRECKGPIHAPGGPPSDPFHTLLA